MSQRKSKYWTNWERVEGQPAPTYNENQYAAFKMPTLTHFPVNSPYGPPAKIPVDKLQELGTWTFTWKGPACVVATAPSGKRLTFRPKKRITP